MKKFFSKKLPTILLLNVFIAGCSVTPKNITYSERKNRVFEDWNKLYNEQDNIPSKITMQMAMARALKYNLDIKIQNFESILVKNDLDVSTFNMLPEILGTAGIISRSNKDAASSLNLSNNTPNFSASTSQDKTIRTADLKFSWDLLNFGVSYLNAKNNANRFMIELHRNRQMAHHIMRDVRYSYWQAYTAQEIEKLNLPLIKELEKAINISKKTMKEKLSPQLESLKYQRSLYDLLRILKELQRNLIEAKTNLATLITLPPGTSFTLSPINLDTSPLPKKFPMDLSLLKRIAIYDRPELQEADYINNISINEISKARLEMLPGLNLSYGKNYTSNDFTLNKNWAQAGAQVSWNALKLFSGANIDVAKTNKQIQDHKRMALNIVTMTQVDVAYRHYYETLEELKANKNLLDIDQKIQVQLQKLHATGKENKLKLIQAKANTVLSKLRHDLAYAEWQNAGGKLLTSIGYDLTAGIDTTKPITEIEKKITSALNHSPEIIPSVIEKYKIPDLNLTKVNNNAK